MDFPWINKMYSIVKKKSESGGPISEEEYNQRREKVYETLGDIGFFRHMEAVDELISDIAYLRKEVDACRKSRLELLRVINEGDIKIPVANPHRHKENEPRTINLIFDGGYENIPTIVNNGRGRNGFLFAANNQPYTIINEFNEDNREKAKTIVNQLQGLNEIYDKLEEMHFNKRGLLIEDAMDNERKQVLDEEISNLDISFPQIRTPRNVKSFLQIIYSSYIFLSGHDEKDREETLSFLESNKVKHIYKKCNVQNHINTIEKDIQNIENSIQEMNRELGEEMPKELSILKL